jgi:hypothetical protein
MRVNDLLPQDDESTADEARWMDREADRDAEWPEDANGWGD